MAKFEIGDSGEWIDTQRPIGPPTDDPEAERFRSADEYEVVEYMDRMEARVKRADGAVLYFFLLSLVMTGVVALQHWQGT